MDAYRTATPDSRASGRHKVATATGWTGVAALAVTGWLTLGLSQGATVASSGSTSTDTSTDDGSTSTDDGSTSSDSTGSSGVTGSSSPAVTTSGGS